MKEALEAISESISNALAEVVHEKSQDKKPTRSKCLGVKLNGDPCGALAMVGRTMCTSHDPEYLAEVEASSKERAIAIAARDRALLLNRDLLLRTRTAEVDLDKLLSRERAVAAKEEEVEKALASINECKGDWWIPVAKALTTRAATLLHNEPAEYERAGTMIEAAREMRLFAFAVSQKKAHPIAQKVGLDYDDE